MSATRAVAALVGAALVVAACGGGGSNAFAHGKKACRKGVPRIVIENAKVNPTMRGAFAQDLRNFVHRTLPKDDYKQAFDGCVDAIWSKELGPRPSP